MIIDQTKIYQEYKGKWVVLDETRTKVLFSGSNLQKIVQAFYQKCGKKKLPTVFKVPTKIMPYVGIIKNEISVC